MMLKLRTFARALLAAGVVACAIPAAAQYAVANSTTSPTVAASPINQIVSNLNAGINNAQWTATTANNQANYAVQVGSNAQGTANWAVAVGQDAHNYADIAYNTGVNAQNTANAIAGRVDQAWSLGIADCAMAMGGAQWQPFCAAVNPRPW